MEHWIWLFPASYLIHVIEETFAGERFYNWTRRIIGRRIPAGAFLLLNACFFALMVAAVSALQAGDWPWLLPALGTVTAVNGLGHLVGSLATRSYSPGSITGLILWIPLGVAALALSGRALPVEDWRRGVATGIGISLAVAGLAWVATRAVRNETSNRGEC